MKQTEIDVGLTEEKGFYLDINGDRVLKSKKLSAIVDKIEEELKENYLQYSEGSKKDKKRSIGNYLGRVAENWNKSK